MDYISAVLTSPLVLVVMGLLIHFGRDVLAAASYGSERPSITDYWKKKPVQTVVTVCSAFVAFAILGYFPDFDKMAPDMQNLVRFTAFSCGFQAASMIDAIGERGMQRARGGG